MVEGKAISWWINRDIQESRLNLSQGWRWVNELYFFGLQKRGPYLTCTIFYARQNFWGKSLILWPVLLLGQFYYWRYKGESKVQTRSIINHRLGQCHTVQIILHKKTNVSPEECKRCYQGLFLFGRWFYSMSPDKSVMNVGADMVGMVKKYKGFE